MGTYEPNAAQEVQVEGLHLGQGNPRHENRVEELSESTPEGKNLEILVDERLDTNSRWALAA